MDEKPTLTSSAAHSEEAIAKQAATLAQESRLRALWRFRLALSLVAGPVALGLSLLLVWSLFDPAELDGQRARVRSIKTAPTACRPFVHSLPPEDFRFNGWNSDGTEVWADIRQGRNVLGVRAKANERADRAQSWDEAQKGSDLRMREVKPLAFCVEGERVRVAGMPSLFLNTFHEECRAGAATTWSLCPPPGRGPCFLSPALPPVSSPCSMATDLALLAQMTDDERTSFYLRHSIVPERLIKQVCRRCPSGPPTLEALYEINGTLWAVVRQGELVSPNEPRMPMVPVHVMMPGSAKSASSSSSSVLLLAGQRAPSEGDTAPLTRR